MVCCPKCKKSLKTVSSLNRHLKDKVCTKNPADVACREGAKTKPGYEEQKREVERVRANLSRSRDHLKRLKETGATAFTMDNAKRSVSVLKERLKREEAILERYR